MADSSWLTPSVVRSSAGIREGTVTDTAALTLAANAAAQYVEELKPEHFVDGPTPVYTPPPTILLGAAMLAHRWYARRGSPLGVAGYTELGSSGILRYDPDIARLLGIGTEGGAFVFGAPTTTTPDPGSGYLQAADYVHVADYDAGVLVIEDEEL